ncbi:MAG TPA: sensor domain-containing protein [Mycobacterium sp.]
MSALRSKALIASLAGLVLLTGCASTVQGAAVKTPASRAERALPSADAVGQAMHLPMQIDAPPLVGGTEILRDDRGTSTPPECVAVTHAGDRNTYRDAPLRSAAKGTWKTPKDTVAGTNAVVYVLELDSPDSAQSWYTKLAARWQPCNGTTVTQRMESLSFTQNISQIADSGGTLTADLLVTTGDGAISPMRNRRALTSSGQYLIDVEVVDSLSGGTDSTTTNTASAVAKLVAGLVPER